MQSGSGRTVPHRASERERERERERETDRQRHIWRGESERRGGRGGHWEYSYRGVLDPSPAEEPQQEQVAKPPPPPLHTTIFSMVPVPVPIIPNTLVGS